MRGNFGQNDVAVGALEKTRSNKLGMSLVAVTQGSRPRPMSFAPINTSTKSGVMFVKRVPKSSVNRRRLPDNRERGRTLRAAR